MHSRLHYSVNENFEGTKQPSKATVKRTFNHINTGSLNTLLITIWLSWLLLVTNPVATYLYHSYSSYYLFPLKITDKVEDIPRVADGSTSQEVGSSYRKANIHRCCLFEHESDAPLCNCCSLTVRQSVTAIAVHRMTTDRAVRHQEGFRTT